MAFLNPHSQFIVNNASSYALQSLFEASAAAGISYGFALTDPLTTTIYAVTKFAVGFPLNYACNEVFEGPGSSTASKVISYFLKSALPLLVAFGVTLLSHVPLSLTTIGYFGLISLGTSLVSTIAQKASFIFELGYAQYRLLP